MLVSVSKLLLNQYNCIKFIFIYWAIDENAMLIYDGFVNCWFVYDNIKLSWKLDGSMWNY